MKPIPHKEILTKFFQHPSTSLVWSFFVGFLLSSTLLVIGIILTIYVNRSLIFGIFTPYISTILLFVLYLLTTIIIWYFINISLQPINELISKIGSFLDGNWEHKINIYRKDEVGILAEQFNSLTEQITSLYITLEANNFNKLREIDPNNISLNQNDLASELLNLNFLSELTQAIITEIDCNSFFLLIFDHLKKLLGDVQLTFYVFDVDNTTVPTYFNNPITENHQTEKSSLIKELLETIKKTKKPIIINHDFSNLASSLGIKDTSNPIELWFGIPILTSNELLGVFTVEGSDQEELFIKLHVDLLKTIGKMIILFLINKRRSTANSKYNDDLHFSDIVSKMRITNNIDDLLRLTVQELQRTLDLNKAQIIIKSSLISPDEQFKSDIKSHDGNGNNS